MKRTNGWIAGATLAALLVATFGWQSPGASQDKAPAKVAPAAPQKPAPQKPVPTEAAPTEAAPAKPAAEAALPTIAQITERLDNLYRASSSHGTVEMTVVNARGTRRLTIEQWTLGEDRALMVIREPSREAGTATLKLEDGLWNYAPRADRLIRIPSGLLSDSWMGSHFTNDDLMRETSYEDDHDTSLAWVTEGGTRYLQVTLVPRPEAPVVWQKIVYLLTAEEWLPVEARYFDAGKVVRTMSFSEIREMGGRRIPTVMTLRPQKEGEYTRMTYKSIAFDVKNDASLFSQQGLRRVARTR